MLGSESHSTPAYSQRVVDLYDQWFPEHLREDIDLYVAVALARGGRVLDAGCGTGRLMLPLLRSGAQVDGVDVTPGMIERCRSKVAAEGYTAELRCQALQRLRMDAHYETAIAAYNVFNFLLSQEDQVAALRALWAHLNPGGLLMLGVGGPDVYRVGQDESMEFLSYRTPDPDAAVQAFVYVAYDHDEIAQIADGRARLELYRDGLLTEQRSERRLRRWVYPAEMRLLLQAAGFEDIRITDTFGDEAEMIEDELVYWATRPPRRPQGVPVDPTRQQIP
jgi:SAM-dependent methyltransferase